MSLGFCLLALLLSCTTDYNPFADSRNAGIVFGSESTSLHNGDTLNIYTTRSFVARIKVRELVSNLQISCPGNRLWATSDTMIDSDMLMEHASFAFDISYSDTGTHEIVMTLHLEEGSQVTESLVVYARNPLQQNAVHIVLGDSTTLRTPPVGDNDVNYYWSFGASSIYSSQRCSLQIAPQSALLRGRGALWVSDGFTPSPADSFTFSFADTIKPRIFCVNEGYLGADTVYTSDSVFALKVRVTDHHDRWVDSVSVDGKSFDSRNNRVYTKWFDRISEYPPAAPLAVKVYALDHFANGNENRKTFWIAYSDSAPRSVPAEIRLLLPSQDSATVSTDSITVLGFVENHSMSPFACSLSLIHNGSETAPGRWIDSATTSFEWALTLAQGNNTIQLRLSESATGAIVDIIERTIVYAPDIPDTISPRILNVLIDGNQSANLFTTRSQVVVGIEAADEAGGIDSMLINGNLLTANSSGGRWYYDTLALAHVPTGNELLIRAVDESGNDTSRTIVVYRNRKAIIQTSPSSSQIPTDSLYIDTVEAFDPDGDSVSYSIVEGPEELAISESGILTWIPDTADTGTHTVVVRIWDGYQPSLSSFSLIVYVQGTLPPPPVQFSTSEEDFPAFLEVGRDSLEVTLEIKGGTGVPPFVFSAYLLRTGEQMLRGSRDSVVRWSPTLSDTGYAKIIVTVGDAFPRSDTLLPRVLIVPPNRPCTIVSTSTSDTLDNGAIDINQKQAADTLTFHIQDPDNPISEIYDITISQWRTQLVNKIDSARVDSFQLVVDPQAFDGYDTITVAVTDRGGNADTLRKTVYYGMPPYTPQVISPISYSSVSGQSVTLSWQTSDPDSDELRYDIYFGTDRQSLQLAGTTTETTHTETDLSSSATYYWRIIAHDWKSRTIGPVWEFTTQ